MSLQQTFARVPVTREPVDGYLVVGALLVVVAALGLLTGLLALSLCGILAVAAVVLLKLSGRERRAEGVDPTAAASSGARAGVAPQAAG